jgi:hypothetical protein
MLLSQNFLILVQLATLLSNQIYKTLFGEFQTGNPSEVLVPFVWSKCGVC